MPFFLYRRHIAVTGSKYDPKSRPPSGRPTTTSDVAPLSGRHSISREVANQTLEEFLKTYTAPDGEKQDLGKFGAS